MASSIILPNTDTAEYKSLQFMSGLLAWAGLTEEPIATIADHLGLPKDKEQLDSFPIRAFAAIPENILDEALKDLKISVIQKGSLKAAHLAAVQMAAVPPTAAPPPTSSTPPPADPKLAELSIVQGARKLKLSNLIDPMDDTELTAAGPDLIEKWFANFKAVKHGPPLPDREPTPDQLSAMHVRIITLKAEP